MKLQNQVDLLISMVIHEEQVEKQKEGPEHITVRCVKMLNCYDKMGWLGRRKA